LGPHLWRGRCLHSFSRLGCRGSTNRQLCHVLGWGWFMEPGILGCHRVYRCEFPLFLRRRNQRVLDSHPMQLGDFRVWGLERWCFCRGGIRKLGLFVLRIVCIMVMVRCLWGLETNCISEVG
jgi:hypothetical protein